MPITFATRERINASETERDIEELLGLFFSEWFDGTTKTLSDNDPATAGLDWPQCDLLFGVATLPRGTDMKPQLHTILNDARGTRQDRKDDDTLTREEDVTITQLIRVAHSGNQERRAYFLARKMADRVKLLLTHETRLDLARKGFHRIRVERGSQEIPMPGYSVRQLTWSLQLRLDQLISTN